MSDESGKTPSGTPPLSAQDALAFMQKMWNPFGMPMPGSASGAVEPTTTPESTAPSQATPGMIPGAIPGAMPGMLAFPNPAAMFAALDPAQVERKIAELRIIEGWLAMSLNLMQMSIKTLELQQASLEALHAGSSAKPKREPKSRKE
jgi:hypothetical protein